MSNYQGNGGWVLVTEAGVELNQQNCSAGSHSGFLIVSLVNKICGVLGWRARRGNGMLGLTCVSELVNRS